jgi:uncharacterized membrane protein YgcG
VKRVAARLVAAAVGILLAALWLMVPVVPAQAAGDDTFDRFDVVAVLDAEGYLQVTETIVLRFGPSSGRHGLERTLTVREPDQDAQGNDTGQDTVLRVDHVSVTSPSGAPDATELIYDGTGTRTEGLRIRVGEADKTVSQPTATYAVSYRVLGLVRSPGGADQLYWDVTGSQMPRIVAANVKVAVPGGALEVFCSAAAPGAQGACATSERATDGGAHFAATGIPVGQVMTVGVKIQPGLVKNNTPILEPDATKATEEQLAVAGAFGFGSFAFSTLAALVVPLIGWRRLRRATADLRFVGLPPGVLPAQDQDVAEARGDPKIEIPVCFAPPIVAVAEAGYLVDGKLDVRDTTATVMSLAVQGAVRLHTGESKKIDLLDRSAATDRPSQTLLRELFPDRKSQKEQSIDLDKPGRLSGAHAKLTSAVQKSAESGRWYAREPSPGGALVGCEVVMKILLGIILFGAGAAIALVFLGTFGVGLVLVALGTLPLVITSYITWVVVRTKSAKGQRSGVGTALTDQIIGFRTYLATAEAEQLQFEEGEDIFSQYLPWAIAFGLTQRWTQICQRLVELGRLSPQAPSWYAGQSWDLNGMSLQLNDFGSSISTASAIPVSSSASSSYSSSDSGFGSSGSSFSSGGGFSGGGGGGGGGGSW